LALRTSPICAPNSAQRWLDADVDQRDPGFNGGWSFSMTVKFHLDRPASFLLNNLSQEFTGWLAASAQTDAAALKFLIDGNAVDVEFHARPDVQKGPGWVSLGWTFRLDHAVMFGHARRTLELKVFRGDECVHSRHFYKSKDLMPAAGNSPLFFMHIPKTAGTALRQFVDCAFGSWPSMLLYGDFPGFPLERFSKEHWQLAKTRELIFGHYDFDLVRTVNDANPKIVTIFRDPMDLVRSYLRFSENPAPEFVDNPLVRHVCGLSYTAPFGLIGEQHLQQALLLVQRHFYIVQQERLQDFADSVTAAFGLPDFQIPQINRNTGTDTAMPAKLPFDVSFDQQLYEACRYPSCDFLEFLNA
jgi:hypothetical protein